MKLLIPLMVLISSTATAGGYYPAGVDIYDPITGLYYKAVEDAPERGGFRSSKSSRTTIININIFDPVTGQSTMLFDEPQKDGISIV